MDNLVGPVESTNLLLLLFGGGVHILLRLSPWLRNKLKHKGPGFSFRYWVADNLIPSIIALLLSFGLLIVISHSPDLVVRFGDYGLPASSFALGLLSDLVVKQFDRLRVKSERVQERLKDTQRPGADNPGE